MYADNSSVFISVNRVSTCIYYQWNRSDSYRGISYSTAWVPKTAKFYEDRKIRTERHFDNTGVQTACGPGWASVDHDGAGESENE